jgi:carbamoyltransferase
MRVLGVHAGHDAAAALLVDGEIVADAAEERFQRVKHAGGFPFHALAFCLEQAGCPAEQLVFDPLVRRGDHPAFDLRRFTVGRQTEVVHVDHHTAHAASAYLTAGFEEPTLVVTCDGVGEGVSTALWRGERGRLTRLASFDAAGSLGWFQGRMESGPRALGGRSILMSPLDPGARETLNARVKFREAFRPFCPSLIAEARERYLPASRPEPFMVTSFEVAPEQRDRIPAVVHVDGTARPQTVERGTDPLFWQLIDSFGRITGEPVVLNTSFNVRGEPIVCDPLDAIRCFYSGGMDHLLLGPFLVSKPGAPG